MEGGVDFTNAIAVGYGELEYNRVMYLQEFLYPRYFIMEGLLA